MRRVLLLALLLLAGLLVAGCGIVDPYSRSRAPEPDGSVVRNAVTATFKEAKLAGTPLVSRIYEASLVTRGDWLLCLRGSNSPKGDTYTLYFVGNGLVATQRSVLVDRCDEQTYAPYDLTPQVAEPQVAAPKVISAPPPMAPTPVSAPQGAAGSSRGSEPLVLTPR